jgi:hypothetical protein
MQKGPGNLLYNAGGHEVRLLPVHFIAFVAILGVLAAAIGVAGSGRREEGASTATVKVLARAEIPRGLVAYYTKPFRAFRVRSKSFRDPPSSSTRSSTARPNWIRAGRRAVLHTWRSGLADDPTRPTPNLAPSP